MGNKAKKKAFIGTVVSDKMDKVVTVQLEIQKRQPIKFKEKQGKNLKSKLESQ